MSSFPQRRHYSHAGQPSEDRWAAPRDNYHQDPQSYGRGGAGGSYDDQSLDDRFSRGVSEVSSLLDPRIDQHRLREDTRYMLQAICGKFQEVDTYHRGLITSAGFSHALQACGLRYGQPEVDKILSYCNVTEDGYVMYKELLTALGPAAPRAKQSSANLAIFPQNSADDMSEYSAGAGYQDSSCSSAAYQAEITPTTNLDVIRKVYAKWERGFLPDSEFKRELIGLGCRPTAELDRLLLTYGPSRSMPFSKLMYALQADENDGRRARNHHEVRSETGSVASSRFHGQDEARQADNASSRTEEMRQLICGFVDGMVPSVSFRRGLNQLSVEFSPELDRLIRIHESDNSVRFADFARLLLRQASSSSNHRGMDDSRDTGWGAGGGSFGGRGGGLGAFARGCGAMEEVLESDRGACCSFNPLGNALPLQNIMPRDQRQHPKELEVAGNEMISSVGTMGRHRAVQPPPKKANLRQNLDAAAAIKETSLVGTMGRMCLRTLLSCHVAQSKRIFYSGHLVQEPNTGTIPAMPAMSTSNLASATSLLVPLQPKLLHSDEKQMSIMAVRPSIL